MASLKRILNKHMKKYFSILSLLLHFIPQAQAGGDKITPALQQQYLLHINKAKLYAKDSLYQKACNEYELAFSIRKDYPILFECAKLYDWLNNTEQTIKYLRLSIEAGCDWYNDDTTLLPNFRKSGKFLTSAQQEAAKHVFYEKLNMDYFLELEKMEAEDQVIRNIKRADYAQITDTEAENKLMDIVDSTHMVDLKKLIKKYGYPQYTTVGYKGETDVFILLLHGLFDSVNDSLDWLYFQPIILKEVKEGRLMPDHYALLYDRVISKYGEQKQCYGTQLGIGPFGRFTLFGEIYDIENVDVRRKEIGLPTLEDQFKLSGMELPKGYVRK